jgi:gamma-tubulin complex component 2
MNSVNSQADGGDSDVLVLQESTQVVERCTKFVHSGNSLRGHPLSDIEDLRLQQGLIIKDLLFCLLGYEGFYIRYSQRYDPYDVNLKIQGAEFKIAKNLDISLKIVTKKLVKFGKMYTGLLGFIEYYNTERFGRIIQRLCMIILEFIDFYQQNMVKIEHEFKFNKSFNLNIFESIVNQEISNKICHLYDIITEIHSITQEKQLIHLHHQQHQNSIDNNDFQYDNLVNIVRDSLQTGNLEINVDTSKFPCCKGGLVLKIIQTRINNYKGDSDSLLYLTSVFDSVSQDYIHMLNNWLMNGEIDDPFDEFLIKKNQVPTNFTEIFDTKSEHYWNELFIIRSDDLIEQLSSVEIQKRILYTGKLLNIFKKSTGLHNFDNFQEAKLKPIRELRDLELKIDIFYIRANKLFLKLLFDGYHFSNIIKQFQSLFLFKDCFKIDKFIDQCFGDLIKNKGSTSLASVRRHYDNQFIRKNKLSKSNHDNELWLKPLTSIDDVLITNQKFTISQSNFFDGAMEIMNVEAFDAERVFKGNNTFENFINITLNKQKSKPKDHTTSNSYDRYHLDEYLISHVDLAIDLPFPLNLVINQQMAYRYELMFKLLMIIKFLSKFNELSWREINFSEVWTFKNFDPSIKILIRKCRVLNKRIGTFLNELMLYVNFDVIESNYNNLNQTIDTIKDKMNQVEPANIDNEKLNDTNWNSFNGNQSAFTHNTFGNYKNANSIFDNMIANGKKESKTNQNRYDTSFEHLIDQLYEYLNTILNDTFINKPILLSLLKKMFDIIILVNHRLNGYMKRLITCNEELFQKYSQDHPERFEGISLDGDLIRTRFDKMNKTVFEFMRIFDDNLVEIVTALKRHGETETKLALILSERLETLL